MRVSVGLSVVWLLGAMVGCATTVGDDDVRPSPVTLATVKVGPALSLSVSRFDYWGWYAKITRTRSPPRPHGGAHIPGGFFPI